MIKPILPFVETMVTQACNISCLGCTNYSDLVHKGYVPWSQGKHWLELWLDRIEIPDFGIMGGEPLLNPEIEFWISGIRSLMPKSQIRFTTNGLLLHKKRDIVRQLAEIGNCVFKITVHSYDDELESLIEELFRKYTWTPVTEHGVHRFKTDNNFRLQIKRPDRFIKTYKGSYADMLPYNSDPVRAFEICCQQQCPLLYNGRIYKCSSNGLLKDTLLYVDNLDGSWAPYINDGIHYDSPISEIIQFIENFGKPHSVCGMCPTSEDSVAMIDHLNNVSYKKVKWIPR